MPDVAATRTEHLEDPAVRIDPLQPAATVDSGMSRRWSLVASAAQVFAAGSSTCATPASAVRCTRVRMRRAAHGSRTCSSS